MIKGIHKVRMRLADGTSRWYIYAWRGGPKIGLVNGRAFPKSLPAEIVRAYAEATKNHNASPPTLFARLIEDYLHSSEWDALSPVTKRVWRRWIDKIKAKFGKAEIGVFEDKRMRGDIKKWRDEFAKSSKRNADMAIQVLHRVIAFGVDDGRLSVNVATGIGKLYEHDRSDIIWEDDERDAFIASRPREHGWVLRLACLTGLRATDLVALPESADKGHRFVWKTSKSGKTTTVIIPILPATRTLLDEIAAAWPLQDGVVRKLDTPILRGQKGRPLKPGTAGEFISDGVKALLAAGIMTEQKHLHDCRGTFATELLLAGLTDSEAAEILGWETQRVKDIRRKYVDDKKIAASIVERLEDARQAREKTKQEQKL